MGDRLKFRQWWRAYPRAWRIKADQFRIGLLQPHQLLHHPVILRIGYLRIIEDIIPVVVMVQCFSQDLNFVDYFGIYDTRHNGGYLTQLRFITN